jgi:hypothetical protein
MEPDIETFESLKAKVQSFSTSKKSSHRQTFVLMMQNLIADTIPEKKESTLEQENQNKRAEEIFETHFKAQFV